MGNACGGSLRSKYLHSFKHPASQRHDPDRDYDHAAAADSPKKQPGSQPTATAAAKTELPLMRQARPLPVL